MEQVEHLKFVRMNDGAMTACLKLYHQNVFNILASSQLRGIPHLPRLQLGSVWLDP